MQLKFGAQNFIWQKPRRIIYNNIRVGKNFAPSFTRTFHDAFHLKRESEIRCCKLEKV